MSTIDGHGGAQPDVHARASDRPRPFDGVPTRDYVTDVVALLLLVLSISLPFVVRDAEVLTAGGVAWVLLATLLSVVSLTLPYLARLGVLPASWTVHTTRRVRVLAGIPYALVFVVHAVLDVTTLTEYRGLGSAVALGLAGAALAATPRASELGPVEADGATTAAWWRVTVGTAYLIVGLAFIWLVLFVVGYLTTESYVRDAIGAKTFALTIIEVLLVTVVVALPVLRTVVSRSVAWRNVAITLGIVLVVTLFIGADLGGDKI
ncbi:MAG: hypothetical protein ACTMIR_08085, partial [Cellulomonadaceae bacterium]